jgi:hypothetical protein
MTKTLAAILAVIHSTAIHASLVNEATTVIDFGQLKLGLCTDEIIRVTYSPSGDAERDTP